MEKKSAQHREMILRLSMRLLTGAALYWGYRLTAQIMAAAGPKEFHSVIHNVLRERPSDRAVLFGAAFYVLSAAGGDLVDILCRRPFAHHFLYPLILILPAAAFGAQWPAYLCTLVASGLFILAKLPVDFIRAPDRSSSRQTAPLVLMTVCVTVAALSFDAFILRKPALTAIWLMAVLSFGRFSEAVRFTFPIAILLSLSGAVAALLIRSGGVGRELFLLNAVVWPYLAGMFSFRRIMPHLRHLNTIMLATAMAGLAVLEWEASAIDGPDAIQAAGEDWKGCPIVETANRREIRVTPGWSVKLGFARGYKPELKKPAGTYRIIALGSSSTEGYGIERAEDVWPAVLERKLNAVGLPYRVEAANAGIAGTTTYTMLLNFQYELLRYRPDMVILYVGYNDEMYDDNLLSEREMYEAACGSDPSHEDGTPAIRLHASGKNPPGIADRMREFLSRFHVYRALDRPLAEMRHDSHGKAGAKRVPAVPLFDFTNSLNVFADICAREGIALVLVGEASLADLTLYKSEMAQAARARGLSFTDASAAMLECADRPEVVFRDPTHLTVRGHDCLAKLLSGLLIRDGFLPGSLP